MLTRRNAIKIGVGSFAYSVNSSVNAKLVNAKSTANYGSNEPYSASCLRSRVVPTHAVNGDVLPEGIETNLQNVCRSIRRASDETGGRLFLLSEVCLQLQQSPLTASQLAKGSFRLDGPELERISVEAQRARAYVAVGFNEYIPEFPGRYFFSSVLFGSNGNIILTYRRLYGLTNKTRPTDVWKEWTAKYGASSALPVADTEIGRIALILGSDMIWPEMTRSLVFRGAEIILNPLGSPAVAPTQVVQRLPGSLDEGDPNIQVMSRRVRAYENMIYMMSCNFGPIGADRNSPQLAMQPSEIIDYRGNLLAASKGTDEQFVTAQIDIQGLRRARCTPGQTNLLAQLQMQLHAQDYLNAKFANIDYLGDENIEVGSVHDAYSQADINDLIKRGIFVAPIK